MLRKELDKISMFEEVVETSPVSQVVLAHAAKEAPTDSTVLILGVKRTRKGIDCSGDS